jgi:hypothetical protein
MRVDGLSVQDALDGEKQSVGRSALGVCVIEDTQHPTWLASSSAVSQFT